MTRDVSFELEEKEEVESQKSVLCKNCGYAITSPAFAVEPHEHTFRNPAGYSFHVLCYSEASGAIEIGEPTTEACWFSGYAWTFAICSECGNHLGWWYSGRDRFAGLVATRLIRK